MKLGKKILLILFVLVLIVGAGVGIKYYSYIKLKTTGVMLKPTTDYDLADVPFYLQNDAQWAKDKIGTSSYSMAASGCLISCLASAMSELDTEVTPGELNEALTKAEAFQGGDLIWYKIKEAYPQIDYQYSKVFSEKTIENELKNKRQPVVKVHMNGSGATHWVLILGAKDGEFMIMDPLNQDQKPIPLSKHGNVYAYRVLIPLNNHD